MLILAMGSAGHFENQMMDEPARILTIGGSDSGGAAGIQADLKTFTVMGVYGMSVLTAVTAQNSVEVAGVYPLPPAFVIQQLTTTLSDYGAAAIKIGFTGRVELIEALAEALAVALATHRAQSTRPFLVVDPVLVNHRREPLFTPAVTRAYVNHLFPLADLVTPNWAEAGLLAGQQVTTWDEVHAAARELLRLGARQVLITGWIEGPEIRDLLATPDQLQSWQQPWQDTINTHGSGDTLSAAIASLLGQGVPLLEAIATARRLTAQAVAAAGPWRLGAGHGPVNHLALLPGQ